MVWSDVICHSFLHPSCLAPPPPLSDCSEEGAESKVELVGPVNCTLLSSISLYLVVDLQNREGKRYKTAQKEGKLWVVVDVHQ